MKYRICYCVLAFMSLLQIVLGNPQYAHSYIATIVILIYLKEIDNGKRNK